MTTKVLKVGVVKTASKFCSRVRKESVSSIGRLPCLGVLLRPQRPRQVAKKSRGSRSDLLLSNPSPNLRNKNLAGGGCGLVEGTDVTRQQAALRDIHPVPPGRHGGPGHAMGQHS